MMARNTSRTLVLWSAVIAALCYSLISSAAGNAGKNAHSSNYVLNEYRASRSNFTLPFHLLNGHLLIDGAVNGRRGRFMFDTGTEFPFFLNNHYLSLSKDQFIAQGHTGSGQEIVIYKENAPVSSIDIGKQVHFETIPAQPHADWSFLEEAYSIPNFLGSIGHGFNQNYLFVLDYDLQSISFHALDQDESVLAGVIDPARVVATLEFTPTGVDGKMPEVELRIGRETITGFFDSGNPGSLELTEAMKNTLEQRGHLILSASEHAYGTYQNHLCGSLNGLSYGAQILHDVRNLDFKPGTRNRVGLGYQFLKNYISVWDYKHRKLTLLKP